MSAPRSVADAPPAAWSFRSVPPGRARKKPGLPSRLTGAPQHSRHQRPATAGARSRSLRHWSKSCGLTVARSRSSSSPAASGSSQPGHWFSVTLMARCSAVRRKIESMGAVPNIPPKANRRWKTASRPLSIATATLSSACPDGSRTSVESQPDTNASPLSSSPSLQSATGYESGA